MTDTNLATEWFAQGDLDIQAVEILLAQNGPLEIVAFHLQQAVEKYLKGFLLASGWSLRRIHDLEVLLQEAIARDADFAAFLPPCQRITEYYIETRYPMGFSTPLQPDTLEADLQTLYALIKLIREKVAS
jgi:HEPN domain-containing protein